MILRDRLQNLKENIFFELSKIIKNNVSKENFLEIPEIDTGFKRLT